MQYHFLLWRAKDIVKVSVVCLQLSYHLSPYLCCSISNAEVTNAMHVCLFVCLFCAQANMNEIVLASTHDVQEVDVSTLLAAQPYTWIGEDFDKESRRSVAPKPPICLLNSVH